MNNARSGHLFENLSRRTAGFGADTDTLLIEFRAVPVAETRDLDENTFLDVDAQGDICAITVEHASTRADAPHFSYKEVAA